MAQPYSLYRRQWLPIPLEEAFAFFERPENLARITPPWLGFQMRTAEPVTMAEGVFLDYTIRVLGLPVRWRSRILEYDPPHGFRDAQVVGPYRRWDHRHRFWAEAGGTVVEDRVEYALPFGIFGRGAHWLFVGRQLAAIFDYRQRRIEELLVQPAA